LRVKALDQGLNETRIGTLRNLAKALDFGLGDLDVWTDPDRTSRREKPTA
jgi:hypothetical protein